jgi:hypothetical protein
MDGKNHVLTDLLRRGPVVLTFTKVGCPCSEAAQPYFNRITSAYPQVTFLGVVNAEAGPATLWTGKLNTAYPHLLDPELNLVRAYGVENSVYVILVDPQGQIAEHWPGISQEMLRKLASGLARLVNTSEKVLDFSEAPEELYSGCPFDL